MKIAIFTNAYKPIISGVVNCIDLMRTHLIRRGHEVYLFAPDFPGFRDTEERVYRYPSVNLTNKIKFPVPIPFSPSAEKVMAENRFDIVHCHHPFILGDEGAKLASRQKAPLFFTFHTQYEQYAHYVPLPAEIVKAVSKSMVSAYSRKCSVIITPGTAIVELLKDYGVTKNVVYMPNSIELSAFGNPDGSMVREKYGFPGGEKVLVYVGRMAQEKNLPFMMDAFKKIKEQAPSKLMIIGEGPELDSFRQYAQENGLEKDVIFTGRVEYEEIPAYYGASDLFVMTSTTEVKPLALLEAMAAGLPIVAVDACGASDTILNGENGFLTKEDREVFAETVVGLLKDEDMLAAMRRRTLEIAEGYSIENVISRLLELYDKAIEEKRISVK